MNYAVQYNALQRRYESLLADMQQVLGLLRRGRNRAALALLDSVLGGESGDESDHESQAGAEAEAEAPAPIVRPTAFVGRSFRLGARVDAADGAVGAAVGAVGDAAVGASGGDAVGDAADETSDSDVEACCRCGDRTNLHVFARSGVWQDVESAAERTYCVDCLSA